MYRKSIKDKDPHYFGMWCSVLEISKEQVEFIFKGQERGGYFFSNYTVSHF